MIVFKCIPFSQFSLEELYELMALRQEVFIVEQDCPYLDADGKDQPAWHVLGYEANQLVACSRLVDKGILYPNHSCIGRVATSLSCRKKGYGKLLMNESIRQIEQVFDTQDIKISAQAYLDKFYRSLGFQPVGEGYLEDNIPHIAMIFDPNLIATK